MSDDENEDSEGGGTPEAGRVGKGHRHKRDPASNNLTPGGNRHTEVEDSLEVNRMGNDVDESAVSTSLISGWPYLDVFQYFQNNGIFRYRDLAPHDLRDESNRLREMKRGFKLAYKLSSASGELFRQLAARNDIDDPQDLESKRSKITISPGYDALVAFGGSLIQIYRRSRSLMNDRQASRFLFDTLRALVRATVDQARLKEFEATEFVTALELTISKLARPGCMFRPKLIVVPGQPIKTTEFEITPNVVLDTYKTVCDPTVRQTVTAADMVRGVGGAVKPLYTSKACYIFNTYIAGAAGEPCPNESTQHVAQFHICALCGVKGHPAYNCGIFRAFMKLVPYSASMAGQVKDDSALPVARGGFNQRGGRGGRGGRGRGGRGRGGYNNNNNNTGNNKAGKGKDDKKGN